MNIYIRSYEIENSTLYFNQACACALHLVSKRPMRLSALDTFPNIDPLSFNSDFFFGIKNRCLCFCGFWRHLLRYWSLLWLALKIVCLYINIISYILLPCLQIKIYPMLFKLTLCAVNLVNKHEEAKVSWEEAAEEGEFFGVEERRWAQRSLCYATLPCHSPWWL